MENLTETLGVSVLGFSIVFIVLFILMLVIMCFKPIFYKNAENEKDKNPKFSEKTEEAAEDEGELIAVLTAAAAASLGLKSTYNLKIKSYRQVQSSIPAWNVISRKENLEQRL